MVKTPELSAFVKAMRRQQASSRIGTQVTERMNIVQSDRLQLFTRRERTGQPLKSSAWRSA